MRASQSRRAGGLLAALIAGTALLAAGFSAQPGRAGTFQNVGFSVQSDGDDQLYSIDLTTGVATPIGPTDFPDIESLTIFQDPDGFLNLIGVDSDLDELVALDPFTGQGTAVGPIVDEFGLPVDCDDTGLTAAGASIPTAATAGPRGVPTIGTAFMSNTNDADGSFTLYELALPANIGDPVVATMIGGPGALGQPVAGLAPDPFDPTLLFGLGGTDPETGFPFDNLVTVNTGDGTTTEVGLLGTPFDVVDGGLDLDPATGILYGLDDGSGSKDRASHLFPIDYSSAVPLVRPRGAFFLVDPAAILTVKDPGGAPLSGFESLAIGPPATTPPTECSGTIQVSVKSLNFGTVDKKKSRSRTFTIRNVSKSEDLTVSIQQPDGPFSVKNSELDFTLEPGERRTIVVNYSPARKSKGKDSADLVIESSDCDNPSVTVHLKGTGKGILHIGPFPVIDPQPAPPPDHVPVFPGLGKGKGGGKK